MQTQYLNQCGEVMGTDKPKPSATSAALRLLRRRDHSTAEIRRKLAERGYNAGGIDRTIQYLLDRSLLDDHRFAAHQADLLVARGRGPIRIRQKLQARGIAGDIVDEVLQSRFTREESLRMCREALSRRFASLKALSERDRARALRFLLQRGFDSETCYAVLGLWTDR